jgi:uncharacterized membrane protein
MNDGRIDLQMFDGRGEFSVTMKRNCSISPQALMWLLALTALFSFAIGIGFALFGAWPILPFVGLEVAALAVAFLVNGRHATDSERIVLRDGSLEVETCNADRIERHRFSAHWVQVITDATRWRVRVALRSHGSEIEIGRHLDAAGRALLAKELRGRLSHARTV